MRRSITNWNSLLASLLAIAAALGPSVAPRVARADPEISEEDDQKARELFRLGESHYAGGRYEKAAVLFDEAYRLSGRPELLLAMVNTYERMGNYPLAIENLRLYLRHPKAKNLPILRDRLQRLETAERDRESEQSRVKQLETLEQERAKEIRRLQQSDQQRSSGATLTAGASAEVDESPSRLPAYLFLAGGAVGIGGAVGFGLAARKARDDASERCTDDGICRASAQKALDRDKRWSILADVSAVVGVSSAAVGAYLLWRTRGQSESEGAPAAQASLRLDGAIVPGGGAIGLAGEF